ncbi:MAG TPA: L,D-transpeptidase family protein [Vicinamibacteria bacterium]|nr:L,D-transpeptidase family protein [Vicinamibacteria bacterium]
MHEGPGPWVVWLGCLLLARPDTGAECRPVWCDGGRPGKGAYEAIDVLRAAEEQGLAPHDYDVNRLESLARTLASGPLPAPSELGAFDAALGASLLRYLSDLGGGRVDPRDVGFGYGAVERLATNELLSRVTTASSLTSVVASLEPGFTQYRRLKDALARYRSLARDLAPPALAEERGVHEGEPYAEASRLARLLRAMGDLPEGAAFEEGTGVYAGPLREAVVRFQARHGLDPDGVLGPATLQRLNVPFSQRVRQIELALERLRWLPRPPPGRFVVVNIPAFRLVGFESMADERPAVQMGVVVGRAARTRTPLFFQEMRYLIFHPSWYPPRSIIRNEIVPELRQDRGYLEAQAMDAVASAEDDAPALAVGEDTAALLEAGLVRIRQRPGARNALGLLKFVLPNAYDVYLHDTPATGLFARARRDFSHGCIRVEDPVALAEFVLAGSDDWTGQRIERAMHGGRTLRVDLGAPVPVFIYYTTTIVRADGRIEFYDDVYGLDRALDAALRARVEAPTAHPLDP